MDVYGALERGAELHRAGRLAEAEAVYRAVLAQDPNQPDALHLLGLIARAAGQTDAAVELIQRAVALRPDLAPAHYNLGRLFHDRGQLQEAEASYRRALAANATYAEALDNLAGVLQAQGRFDEARASYEQARALRPNQPQTLSNLGSLLQQLGRSDEAITLYEQALRLQPEFTPALHNLGEALQDVHRSSEAVTAYERAIAVDPAYADAHCGLAFALLRGGQLTRGWEEYEWRFRRHDAPARPDVAAPAWNGSHPAGKRILVYAEQGYGDTIQFARYIPLLADRGANVILECQAALAPVLRTLRGVQEAVVRGASLPQFDLHASVMSLPRLFGTTLDTIPAEVPYLTAPRQPKLPAASGLRVGLVWTANPFNQQARSFRSIPFEQLEPLAAVDGAAFYCLQPDPPTGASRLHLRPLRLNDFGDTAAAIAQLDLVITVDTAVAHLAGALAKPVWVMLPYLADWRWLEERQDSPWYPTMQLFRQPDWGTWGPVIGAVAAALATLCKSRTAK